MTKRKILASVAPRVKLLFNQIESHLRCIEHASHPELCGSDDLEHLLDHLVDQNASAPTGSGPKKVNSAPDSVAVAGSQGTHRAPPT